jgi:hypothetical protein
VSLSNSDLLKKVKQFSEVDLTLFNEKGESHRAGELRTLTHKNNGIRMVWGKNRPFTNIHPLTHAVIHRGSKVWNVIGIRPINNDVEGTEIEITYDY